MKNGMRAQCGARDLGGRRLFECCSMVLEVGDALFRGGLRSQQRFKRTSVYYTHTVVIWWSKCQRVDREIPPRGRVVVRYGHEESDGAHRSSVVCIVQQERRLDCRAGYRGMVAENTALTGLPT